MKHRYRTVDIVSGVARVAPFKYAEEATVIEVRILGVLLLLLLLLLLQ